MLTLYNVVSEDGFIADKNGKEDFIPETLWVNSLNMYKEYGSVIMGRRTYETIQSYDKELLIPFELLPFKKIVITNDINFKAKQKYVVVHSPEDAITLAPNSLVSSGPTLNNVLLRMNAVKKIILHVVPVLIGKGIKPFDEDLIKTMKPVKYAPQLEGVKVKEFIK
ncbi:MAG: Bifunctional deaminase-reductase protein [Candidatus Nomurabacteria bacterium]|nr:Bifunctional deaminase-reductase protein [Candidatus Nomurabacteria bacterium]